VSLALFTELLLPFAPPLTDNRASSLGRFYLRESAKDASNQEVAMLDIAMLLLGFGSFALLIGYIPLCERL
jgi:hypothetical protein